MDVYQTLKEYIDAGDTEESVLYGLYVIKEEKITIVDLYEKVLSKILNTIDCDQSDDACIWYEHQRTAIVRNIVDALFPYVIKQKRVKNGRKVLVLCPSEEYHELGAKMASDFFYMLGYDTTFVGANTPIETMLSAIKAIQPDYLAISVTNYYNLVTAKKMVEQVRALDDSMQILAGGLAFKLPDAKDIVGVDALIFSYQDILALEGKE